MIKNRAVLFFTVILLILSGCVTVESLRNLPEEKLKYYSGFYAENLYRQEIISRHPEWPEKVKQAQDLPSTFLASKIDGCFQL